MSKTIAAQVLYDRHTELAEIDGKELHAAFLALTGDPSPRGHVHIKITAIRRYAAELRRTAAAHRASGGRGERYIVDLAAFLDAVAA